jgi:hypothetical protein
MACGEMTEAKFIDFLGRALGLLERHSKPGSVHFICMDWRHVGELLTAGKQPMTHSSICVFGLKITVEWGRFIDLNMNWCSCSEKALNPTVTRFSSESLGATAPTFGAIPHPFAIR